MVKRDDFRKAKFQELSNLAKACCFQLLSKEYVNDGSRLLFRCDQNHQFERSAREIFNHGLRCSRCRTSSGVGYVGRPKLDIETFHQLAKSRGGECLSTVYVNVSELLTFRCAHGHTWQANGHKIKNNGTWCPICAHTDRCLSPMTTERLRSAVEQKGLTLLSKQVLRSSDRVELSCANGHKFNSVAFYIIRPDTNCPDCNKEKRKNRG